MNEISISVRALVEFILREGDIDNRRTHASEAAMLAGGRIHRKIQKAQGSAYHSEVPLEYTFISKNEDIAIILDGRADGIIEGEPVTIDEIKGTYKRIDRITEPVGVHLAQAKCYAFMYANEYELESIDVQLTYCNLDTEEIVRFNNLFTYEELEGWFTALMEEYEKWARMEMEWKQIRNVSIRELEFPFEYRKGQKELVTHVYHTIVHGKKLFIEAPTGVGKTISTVFPTVKAMGEGKAERVFYLTAKTITRTVADNTFEILRQKALKIKSVIITAKDKACFKEETDCNPEYCEFARGHFDRINEALYAILTECENYNRETIEAYAIKYQVCPFEFCLDISLFADAIICDYNYLFDPHVYLKRFFAEGKTGKNIFLIDEAHNLVDRGRSMYSATLVKEDFMELKKSVKVYDGTLAKRLEKCNHELLLLKRECEGLNRLYSIEPFVRALERLYSAMESYLENHDSSPVRDEVLDFYFEVSHFLYIYELVNEKYIMYSFYLDNGDFALRLYCVDPSSNLAECMKRGISSILFSATLLPIQYYKGLLGGTADDYEVYADSTFDPSRRMLFIADNVTSKYTERGDEMYERIAEYINEIVNAKVGNYMVFLPSYSFMRAVWDAYEQRYGTQSDNIKCIIQDDHMTEEQREEFLEHFTGDNDTAYVGFCVLGGIFSEGIDLKNDSLIGAIIVGTGIPLVCKENELIKEYFDENGDNGMQYAYIYPGFNKVQQAAGRVIRTHEDAGIVALLDYRFNYSSYRELFPREWKGVKRLGLAELREVLDSFWTGI